MKYLKSVVEAPVERLFAVVTDKAVGLNCWNGSRGFSGREWVEFFPKSQIKIGKVRDGKQSLFIPYWLFKKKGIYPNYMMDITFSDELVEV